jgi:hypothetical protein
MLPDSQRTLILSASHEKSCPIIKRTGGKLYHILFVTLNSITHTKRYSPNIGDRNETIFRDYIYIDVNTVLFCKMQSDENVRIMIFNIRYGVAQDGLNSWEYRQSILIDCLKKHKPDMS